MGKAAQARFDEANKNKEIPGGRTIKYVSTGADEGTPDGALAAVRGLVEQDGVFAIVPAASVFGGPGLTTYLNSKQVPVVGWGILPGMCTKDPKGGFFFAITGCLVAPPDFSYYTDTTKGMTTLLKELDKPKSIALVCESYETSVQACARLAAAYKKAGFKVPYSAGELQATGQGDYTPVIQKVLAGNPSAVNMLTTAGNGLGMVKALQQAGFTGVIQTVFYAPQLIVPLKDTYTSTGWATPESTAPAMKKAVKTLNDAGITQIGTGELVGYFSADYFIKLLQATGQEPDRPELPEDCVEVHVPAQGRDRADVLPAGLPGGTVLHQSLQEQRHGMGGRGPLRVLPDCPEEEGRHLHAGALPEWGEIARRSTAGRLPGSHVATDWSTGGPRENRPAAIAR